MRKTTPRIPVMSMTLAAGLLAAPMLAFAQADGTPGNPPGTAVGRAIDRATGTPTAPDGTPGNPPGTAVGRAIDRATGTPTSPDGTGNNPPGTAVDRAAERVGDNVRAAFVAPGTAAGERPRVSQLIGANVYNEANERIGEVDDIVLAAPNMNAPVAVIQVGGFLGMGGRLVMVPLADLRWQADRERVMLPGASKEALQARPAFSYDSLRRS